MASLEEKIRALLETKDISGEDTLLEKVVATDKDGDKMELQKDDKEDEDQDEDDDIEDGEDDGDQDQDEDDTDVAKDTKKDKVKVDEGTDPFGKLVNTSGDTDKGADNAKIEAGKGRKEGSSYKLKDGVSADKQEDNGDNAKIQKGKSNADKTAGKLVDKDLGYTDDDANGFKKVDQKTGLSEHMAALFSGEDLSEEFQTKAATIFEAAVNQAAADHVAQLEEQYENELQEATDNIRSELDEAVQEAKSELTEQIDGFLNEAVNSWISENRVELERGMKLDLVDSFIDGMKSLFKEHYVEVPEEKLDVISEQADQIEALTAQIADLQETAQSLSSKVTEAARSDVLESVGSDLTMTQQEKFASLCESIEFTDVVEFEQKIKTIKGSYFPVGRRSEVITEEVKTEVSDDTMSKYVKTIANGIRF